MCRIVVSLAYLTYAFAQPLPGSIGILIALLVYIAFFAVSLSPLMFVVTAEIYPSAIRGTAMALSTGISWACAFLVVQFFPIMLESFGAAIVFAGFGSPLPCCMAVYLHLDSRNQRAFA